MRLQPHILKAIEAELAQRPSKIGQMLLDQYLRWEERYIKNMNKPEPDCLPNTSKYVHEFGEASKSWLYIRVDEREAAKRKGQ